MINVEVERNHNENTASVIRRFTKRVQGSGIVKRVRGNRYYDRVKSRNVRRKKALNVLVKRAKYQELLKMGKIQEPQQKY
jgi:ribosomal protein S21